MDEEEAINSQNAEGSASGSGAAQGEETMSKNAIKKAAKLVSR
jgi:hypothetical protein